MHAVLVRPTRGKLAATGSDGYLGDDVHAGDKPTMNADGIASMSYTHSLTQHIHSGAVLRQGQGATPPQSESAPWPLNEIFRECNCTSGMIKNLVIDYTYVLVLCQTLHIAGIPRRRHLSLIHI